MSNRDRYGRLYAANPQPTYRAVLSHPGQYNGLTKEGETPMAASEALACAMTGHESIQYRANFHCNTVGIGWLWRRFQPETRYRVDITEV